MRIRKLRLTLAATAIACCLTTLANAEPLSVEMIRQLTDQHTRPAIALYRDFLSLPNDANYPDDIMRLVEETVSGVAGEVGGCTAQHGKRVDHVVVPGRLADKLDSAAPAGEAVQGGAQLIERCFIPVGSPEPAGVPRASHDVFDELEQRDEPEGLLQVLERS